MFGGLNDCCGWTNDTLRARRSNAKAPIILLRRAATRFILGAWAGWRAGKLIASHTHARETTNTLENEGCGRLRGRGWTIAHVWEWESIPKGAELDPTLCSPENGEIRVVSTRGVRKRRRRSVLAWPALARLIADSRIIKFVPVIYRARVRERKRDVCVPAAGAALLPHWRSADNADNYTFITPASEDQQGWILKSLQLIRTF